MGDRDPRESELRLTEPGYPRLLRHIPDPPERIFVCGALAPAMSREESALEPAIAVVGARDASAYGLALARSLSRDLASRGVVVVSGLATGIDGAAHHGALEARGRTIAVVGAGTDVVYPRCHARLRREVLEHGAILGEWPAGTPPLRHHFPSRNRLISGLALGVVVVEATRRSGSLITARHALEQGREIFAVPGPVTSPRSRGPHWLLKAGARLVESIDDILEELPGLQTGAPGLVDDALRQAPEPAREILSFLVDGASSVDQLAARSGREVSEIWKDLLDLELQGAIVRGPAGCFVPVARQRGDSGRCRSGPG